MTSCDRCLNGCGGSRADCPLVEWQYDHTGKTGPAPAYNRAIADKICMALARGETLRSIARTEGMPTRQTIKTWVLRDHDGFAARYDLAYRLGLDEMADQILDISDDGARDYKTAPDGREVPDYDHIQRSKLRVDARKWLLARRLPKEYGDRLDLNATVRREAGEFTDAELLSIASSGRQGNSAAEEDQE